MVSDRRTGIIDATLAGSDRMTGYTAINLTNAALVVGCALLAVHRASVP